MNAIITSAPLWYARIAGIVLTIVAILGLAATTSQTEVATAVGMDVNLTHNLLHLTAGILGIVAGWMLITTVRSYALVVGVIFTVLGVWGLAEGAAFDPFGLFVQVNVAASVFHVVIGVLGIASWALVRDSATELAS